MLSFTTTNGVELGIGDRYWYVQKGLYGLKLYAITICSWQDFPKGIVQFSTQEKALQYMKENSVRTVIMIPARMNSKRVSKKNIRLLNGKPLIAYSIELAVQAKKYGLVDEVYVNSEDEIFSLLCKEYGVQFYKRDPRLSEDHVQNDDFAQDFFMKIDCDVMIQILPTSPFISCKVLGEFIAERHREDYDTLVSVKNVQIECMYDKQPINFIKSQTTCPSQLLHPVQAYACALMGWKKETYLSNMHIGGAYHGFTGKTGYFPLNGYANIDIDSEDDFKVAEHIALALANPVHEEPKYYDPGGTGASYQQVYEIINAESDVQGILHRDGVGVVDLYHASNIVQNVFGIIEANSKEYSWAKRLVESPSNSATLISQMPGEGNRMHYHPDWDEWWYIVAGSYEFEICGHKYVAVAGDRVFIKRGAVHKITATGSEPAVRLAVSRSDVKHVYVKQRAEEEI